MFVSYICNTRLVVSEKQELTANSQRRHSKELRIRLPSFKKLRVGVDDGYWVPEN